MRTARMRLLAHPDKACDLVAESIVDEYLKRDPESRVRVSVAGGRGALFISGDVKSQADFDVAALVRRVLGSIGVMSEIEPFVSLEPVVPDQASSFSMGAESVVTVVGYATNETSEQSPLPLQCARNIAKAIEEKRQTDETWFWLGGDGEIAVTADARQVIRVDAFLEHGTQTMADVRREVEACIRPFTPAAQIVVNAAGHNEVRGIGNMMGASGRESSPYGDLLPHPSRFVGRDIRSPEKAGTWLARAAARQLVLRGARAAMVTLVYIPGEDQPVMIAARDERGKDICQAIDVETVSLSRVVREWWRPGLNVDAIRWGFVGDKDLPWEA